MRRDYHSGSGKLLGYTAPFNERRTDCYDGDGLFAGWIRMELITRKGLK